MIASENTMTCPNTVVADVVPSVKSNERLLVQRDFPYCVITLAHSRETPARYRLAPGRFRWAGRWRGLMQTDENEP